RMDISIQVPKVSIEQLQNQQRRRSSSSYRKGVLACLKRQEQRFNGDAQLRNGNMNLRQIKKHCHLSSAGEALMAKAYERMGLTVRSYHKVLKVSRTIADLEGVDRIEENHLLEALGYRLNLRNPGTEVDE
ncbi:magnesium chelatase, partial [Lachnospiraceae bacterium OttesenSCG-928-J05]|nr:magnesium chelatase [Lachnospiraceae bacterium OttesenSCG-928-J05]